MIPKPEHGFAIGRPRATFVSGSVTDFETRLGLHRHTSPCSISANDSSAIASASSSVANRMLVSRSTMLTCGLRITRNACEGAGDALAFARPATLDDHALGKNRIVRVPVVRRAAREVVEQPVQDRRARRASARLGSGTDGSCTSNA
jgi:hypothetical protein